MYMYHLQINQDVPLHLVQYSTSFTITHFFNCGMLLIQVFCERDMLKKNPPKINNSAAVLYLYKFLVHSFN